MAVFASAFHKANVRLRSRWPCFRLDMTPLVDLAFLLLTFFLLHVGMAKPHVMQLAMPSYNSQHACEEYHIDGVITIMLGRNHQLQYYYGLNNPLDKQVPPPELKSTNFSAQGIRQVLLTQSGLNENTLLIKPAYTSVNLILIKPTPQATYKDIVDILDEIKITGQRMYALVKISANDTRLLRQYGY